MIWVIYEHKQENTSTAAGKKQEPGRKQAGISAQLVPPPGLEVRSNPKEHFIASIRNKQLVINHLTLTNLRRGMVGECTLMTGNGILRGKATPALPEGLMRYSIVIAKNGDKEQVVLFQATPVVPSADCKDGNCAIR